MAHNCPECGTDVADDDRIVCDECDAIPVVPPFPEPHPCPCCGNPVTSIFGPNSRCEGCRAGDEYDRCNPAITGHADWYPPLDD